MYECEVSQQNIAFREIVNSVGGKSHSRKMVCLVFSPSCYKWLHRLGVLMHECEVP